ncbi:MAG: hypothetical protein EBR09_02575 [Proteobacteria bacterium]|nr:hypothetical protein [Pseudomonadota bacterium]
MRNARFRASASQTGHCGSAWHRLTLLVLAAQCLGGHVPLPRKAPHDGGKLSRLSDSFDFGRSGHNIQILDDGRLLVAGGAWGDLGGEQWAEIIDSKISKINTLEKPMAHLRSGATQAKLPDGRIMLIGGAADFDDALGTTDIFDPKSDKFIEGPAMAEARAGHASVTLPDGRIIVFGGSNGDNFSGSAEIWEPATGSFRTLSSQMKTARSGHTATLLNSTTVAIIGGETSPAEKTAGDDAGYLAEIELFDIPTLSFIPETYRLQTGRTFHTTTALDENRILIAGGLSAPQQGTDHIEIFDLRTKTVVFGGLLTGARALHTGSRLRDGTILFAGGVGQGTPLASTERCTVSNSDEVLCSAGPKMSITRWMHAATLLPDGRLMISGGLSETPERKRKRSGPSRRLEIFTP